MLADTCADRKTVMKAISNLESMGLITVERGEGSVNKYRLTGVACRHETSPKNGTGSSGKSSTKNGTSPKNGTSTKSGTAPVPKAGHHQSQKRDTNRSRTYQEPMTADDACAREATGFQQLKTKLAALRFTQQQVNATSVLAKIRDWVEIGATADDLEVITQSIRDRGKTDFGPGYIDRPLREYIHAKRQSAPSGASGSQSCGLTGAAREQAQWFEDIKQLYAEAEAEEAAAAENADAGDFHETAGEVRPPVDDAVSDCGNDATGSSGVVAGTGRHSA